MGFFHLFSKKELQTGISRWQETPGAILLDVRTDEEYRMGHLRGSKHLPLQEISRLPEQITDRNTPLFLYCRSGARAGSALSYLKKMGYTAVYNIGGLRGYRGDLERGEGERL